MTRIVMGIESSCDDTSVSLVTENKEILANVVITQFEEHSLYQGVVPEIAARSHMKNLDDAILQALEESQTKLNEVDAIAVTAGPGLIGGVIVGTMYAKSLASILGKPFIAVNHLEGHILTPFLTNEIAYPYLSLLVSGGHCQFIKVSEFSSYKILGRTLDDAVGEAFDKVAKMLGLGYPGGPVVEKLALCGDNLAYDLPFSMVKRTGCDLSFSGLKTAVRRIVESHGSIDDKFKQDICASFQYTIGEILAKRTLNAIEIFMQDERVEKSNYHFILSGGVAANNYLRSRIEKEISPIGWQLIAPPISLCTDNAAMIAWVGIERLKRGQFDQLSFCPRARWSLEEC